MGNGSSLSLDLALAGRWEVEEEQPMAFGGRVRLSSMDILKDGTGVIYYDISGGAGTGISWNTEKNRLYLFVHFNGTQHGQVFDYKISEETLTLTTDDSVNVTYKRR
jgi:hypothetical protein